MSAKKNKKGSKKTIRWVITIIAVLYALGSLLLIVVEPIGAIITFLIFAAIAFFVCPARKKLQKKNEPAPEPEKTKTNSFEFIRPKQNFLGPAELPGKKDGVPEAYRYLVPFSVSNEKDVLSAESHDWRLTAQDNNGVVYLFSGEIQVGTLDHPKAEMLRDWIRHKEPYEIIVRTHEAPNEFQLLLVFYRDKSKYYQHREQEVVSLVSYKSGAKQEIISCLDHGDEVKLDDNYDLSGTNGVYVTYNGEAIGKLPAKAARRFEDEGAACALVEEIKEELNDNYDTVYIPMIRIYW